MAKVKVRRTNREELPGVAVLRDAAAADLSAFAGGRRVLDLDMDVDPDLVHLMAHDPDGFFTATDRDETLGFAAAHVRSRQWVLSELWVLPQHRGRGAGEALLTRALAYGERSGAREYLAVAPVDGGMESLLLRHGFAALAPVYQLELSLDAADRIGKVLSAMLPSREVSGDILKRKGQADLDRIDRLTRGISREADHVFWITARRATATFVRQGDRIAAYAYGGPEQVGPVAGATQDAALCGLGCALKQAARLTRSGRLVVRVPGRFVPAVDALLDGGVHLAATLLAYGRNVSATFDRCVLGSPSLP